jgi:hypothetical protein
MADAVGPYLSFATGVGDIFASTDVRIASTLTNSSGCLVFGPDLTSSRGALILHFFLPSWLIAPIFGGAIMGSVWFLLTNASLVLPVSTHFDSRCSISLQFHDYTMGLMFPSLPLYIGKS